VNRALEALSTSARADLTDASLAAAVAADAEELLSSLSFMFRCLLCFVFIRLSWIGCGRLRLRLFVSLPKRRPVQVFPRLHVPLPLRLRPWL
jgi:hypothetical protein